MQKTSENHYEVIIIGGGVIGSALLYVLSKYTDIQKIALVEGQSGIAKVNSHYTNNSQTLHFGDIETNYNLEKAALVKEAAEMVKSYLLKHETEKIYNKSYKMVLAVGERETKELADRIEQFKQVFPHIKKFSRQDIAQLEPKIVEGRNPNEKLLGLYSDDGFAVNYQKLSQSFVKEALSTDKPVEVYLNTEIKKIKKIGDHYDLISQNKIFSADFVVASVGGESLHFAKSLGYGENLGILPVAGNFYRATKLLKGKIYTMQTKKLPFAAVHGDASVDNPDETRFGPTAKVLPLLERHNYKTVWSFLRVSFLSLAGIMTILKVLSDWVILRYVLVNFTYDIPFLGKYLFLKNVKKIIPAATANQIAFARGFGGVRPQLVNMKTRQLEMGEAKIIGEKIIFNITPSPGASVCLKNAEKDATLITESLEKHFDAEKFKAELA